jgi:hypothetical protein
MGDASLPPRQFTSVLEGGPGRTMCEPPPASSGAPESSRCIGFEPPGPRLGAAAYGAHPGGPSSGGSSLHTGSHVPITAIVRLRGASSAGGDVGALSRTTRPANAHSRMRPDLSRPGPSSILVAMSARARASAVLSVLGWMFVGACVGAGLGLVMGAVFVAIQQRGETDPVTGEWSGLVVLIFQFWGGVVGGLLFGVGAMLKRGSRRSRRVHPPLPPPPPR